MEIFWGIVGFILGVTITAVIASAIIKSKEVDTVGTLQIDRSGRSRGPFIFLELDDDINWYSYTEVKLKVRNQDLATYDPNWD